MRAEQRPPTVGIVAACGYLVTVFTPYVALSSAEAAGLEVYYSFGIAGPHVLALLSLVAVVLFAAGRQDRTDPAFASGLTLVIGIVLTLLVLGWAIAVPEDVVGSLGTGDWLEYHRWVLVVCAFGVAVSSAWYARALSLI